jgi:hypothetical protein
MIHYVKVKNNIITGLAKLEDPPMPLEAGEVQYICPPYDLMYEPKIGWVWNDANPMPATAADQKKAEDAAKAEAEAKFKADAKAEADARAKAEADAKAAAKPPTTPHKP